MAGDSQNWSRQLTRSLSTGGLTYIHTYTRNCLGRKGFKEFFSATPLLGLYLRRASIRRIIPISLLPHQLLDLPSAFITWDLGGVTDIINIACIIDCPVKTAIAIIEEYLH